MYNLFYFFNFFFDIVLSLSVEGLLSTGPTPSSFFYLFKKKLSSVAIFMEDLSSTGLPCLINIPSVDGAVLQTHL